MATKKNHYELRGHIENSDIDFREYVWAYSEAQAKLLIHRRLHKLYPRMVIYVEWYAVQFASPLKKPMNIGAPVR